MKYKFIRILCFTLLAAGIAACTPGMKSTTEKRYAFADILDISYTPDTLHRCYGWFTDAGSWMGFTPPERQQWVNGFCGPFSLDMFRRQWMAQSAAVVGFAKDTQNIFVPDSTCYYPGELYMSAHSTHGSITQRLNFTSASTALLRIEADTAEDLLFSGSQWGKDITVSVEQNSVIARHPSGETVTVTFTPNVELAKTDNNYTALVRSPRYPVNVAISFFTSEKEMTANLQNLPGLLNNPAPALQANAERWEGYLTKILRKDMKPEYDRIAVKAVTTLISNWRTHRGGLLHEGIIPSHAVGYFVGFWAWDSWRFSAGTAKFDPELAKNNIRAMFDYQQPDGMIIDCIYTDPSENNARDSKPPLVCWAVDEIFTHTGDTAFVAEMYPQLLSYYRWWYEKRDHNRNGMCEYGATDGTLEAAAWESGMDNGVRFDDAVMQKNSEKAWSMNQENICLNSFLYVDKTILAEMATLLNKPELAAQLNAEAKVIKEFVQTKMWDKETGFFYDTRIDTGEHIKVMGAECWLPLWAGIATPEQAKQVMQKMMDPQKFNSTLPLGTLDISHPRLRPVRGYWRGPVWVDQVYFGITGLRNYGFDREADILTEKFINNAQGLTTDGPIHENYNPLTGEALNSPNFGWSSACIIKMLLDE